MAPARLSEQADTEAEVEQRRRGAEPGGAAPLVPAAAEAWPSRLARKRRAFDQQDARVPADSNSVPGRLLSTCRQSQEEARRKRQRRHQSNSSHAARRQPQRAAVSPVDVRPENAGLGWQQRQGQEPGAVRCAALSIAAEPYASGAGEVAQQMEEGAPAALQPGPRPAGEEGQPGTTAWTGRWLDGAASMWQQLVRGGRDG